MTGSTDRLCRDGAAFPDGTRRALVRDMLDGTEPSRSIPVQDVFYQESMSLPSAAADCAEAARQVLAELGSKPDVDGHRVSAELGSFLATRAFVGLFCPLRWLPIVVTVEVGEVDLRDGAGQRNVLVGVGDRLPFPIYLGRSRYKARCKQLAASVRDSIAERL